MAGAQIVGNVNSTTAAEVEVNTKALRTVIRPNDFGSLGMYSVGSTNGATVMAAGLAANSPIYSFRWGDATRFALIKKVIISAGGVVGFAAGVVVFNLFIARSFSVADTGGTSILPTGSSNKLKTTGMGTTLLSDLRTSATATLTAGTRTKDGQAASSIAVSVPVTAGNPIIAPSALWQAQAGDFPIVFAQNEGFVIEATVPATGTWSFGVQTVWEELTAYP